MKQSLRVGLLYGGRSQEHEISIQSAKNLGKHLSSAGYTVYPIGITPEGSWFMQPSLNNPIFAQENQRVCAIPPKGLFYAYTTKALPCDIYFPITHGLEGEDGMIQSILELTNSAYVGSDVPSSSIGMHKHMAKMVARHLHIPTVPSLVASHSQPISYSCAQKQLGSSLILKPEDGGSSIGIIVLECYDETLFDTSIEHALTLCNKVLIEQKIFPLDEYECAVLYDQGTLRISEPGLICKTKDQKAGFFTYEEKYQGTEHAYITMNTPLSDNQKSLITRYAFLLAQEIGVSDFARVDFFVNRHTQEIYFNEINTLPGLTEQSHFPSLLSHMGYDWNRFLDTVIKSALARRKHKE